MSENEIKENNKLIARFMGWKVEKNCFSKVEKYGDKLQNERGISVKNRDYHSDWNLLMQVVDKIESLGFWTKIGGHTSFGKQYKQCCIKKQTKDSDIGYIYEYEGDWCESKIESTYNAVVEFIKWYNAQSFS